MSSTPHAVVHYTRKHDGETAAEELDGMFLENRILKARLLPMMVHAHGGQHAQQQAVSTSRVIALHNLLPAGQPPFLLEADSMIRTAVAIVFICFFAALLGIRKVAKLEPAIVFRG